MEQLNIIENIKSLSKGSKYHIINVHKAMADFARSPSVTLAFLGIPSADKALTCSPFLKIVTNGRPFTPNSLALDLF